MYLTKRLYTSQVLIALRDLRCGVFQEFCAASGPQSQYFPPDFRCNSTLRQVVLPLSAGKSAQEPEPG